MAEVQDRTSHLDFLAGGGEMGRLLREHDWATSPLGAPETWPQSLRSVVGLMLGSRYPMFVAWGPELAFLYNDGYAPILGSKHPHALGRPFREVWSEIWADLKPLAEKALSGEATFHENLHLVMERNGYPEDTWYSFSYSPVRDERGAVAGIFCACTETTGQVLAEQRLRQSEERQRFLLDLVDRTRRLTDPEEIVAATTCALGVRLVATRVTYAEIEDANDRARAFGEWTNGTAAHLPPVVRMSDFGSRLIDRLRAGGTLRVDDAALDPHTADSLPALEAVTARAIVSVPLFKDERFVVNLNVHQDRPRHWTDDEVALIEDVAERTWEAVERARAEAALRAEAAAMGRLQAIGAMLVQEDSLEAIYERILDAAAELMGSDFASLQMLDPVQGDLRLLASRAFHPESAAFWESVEAGSESACGAALESGARVVVADVEDWPTIAGTGDLDAFRRSGIRAVQSTPLRSRSGAPVGMISTHWLEPHEPDERSLRSLDLLARQAADVLERALALAALRENEARLRESEARYRQIVEGADDFAIMTLDQHGIITGWNSGARRIVGYGRDEAVGQDNEILFTPEDRAAGAPDHEMNRANSDARSVNERWHLRKDGTRFWGSGLTMRIEGGNGYLKMFRDRTAEHEADARVRESEARFRTLVEAIPQLVWTSLAEGQWDYASRQWVDYTGQAESEALGMGWLHVVHPDDREATLRAWDGAEANGRLDVEHRLRRHDGAYRWFQTRAAPLRDDQGAVAKWFGTCTDVDEVRRARDELRESEARFREVANAAPVLIWLADADNQGAWYNKAWLDFTGRPLEEELGDGWLAAVHPDDLARCAEVCGGSFARREPFRLDFRLRRADGEWRVIDDTGVPRFGADGCFLGYIGSCVDVTDARRSEEVLRSTNASLEERVAERTADRDRMWRLSTDLLLVARFDATITAVNPAWTALLGWSEDELMGRRFTELVHPDDVEATIAEAGRLADGFTTLRFENRYAHRNGSYRHLSWTAVPGAGFIHAVARDVTAEKEAASELAQAQEALRQSQKMEAMGQLTGGVAHDFNNLLTPIVGSLDMLMRRGLGNEREQRLIGGAMQSAERAKTLVQRLLAFARRQPLQAAPVDLPQLVNGMAGLIGSTLGPKIDIRVELADDLPPARADANQLEMALLNLAVNARDAMADGGVLTVAVAPESIGAGHRSNLKQGHYVRLSVSDTGTGMDADTLAQAVEPFFSTKGIGKGTGLGLSMVHGLAAQLGGGLTIRSEVGRGTTVELWLPISTEPLKDASGEMNEQPPERTRGQALLVDDEELVRMSTADMLADLGYDVTEASSAEEALLLLRQGASPDLLVTDHLMPGMSGVELAREARLLNADLPVLIVSGYAELDGIASDIPRLTKPFRNSELAERLADLRLPTTG